MKKVLLSTCMAMALSITSGYAQDAGVPEYPEVLSFTLNGQTKLDGVTAEQDFSQGSLSIDIQGDCEADEITLTFDVPNGWDGFYIASGDALISDVEPLKTRAEDDESDWIPVEYLSYNGFQKGNSVTFATDGEYHGAALILYKGEQALYNTITVEFEVSKSEGSVEPEEPGEPESPEYPESFEVAVSPQGLTVTQDVTQHPYFGTEMTLIQIQGETKESQVSVTLSVPEGWDGFVGMTDQDITPETVPATRASEDESWTPVEELEEEYDCKPGNKYTFKIDGEQHGGYVYLVKDGQALFSKSIMLSMEVMPKRPEFPAISDIKVEVSAEGPEVTVEKKYYTNIDVVGECEAEEIKVTIEIPEGWDGIISDYDVEVDDADVDYAETWQPVDAMLEAGYVKGNEFTFKVDGETNRVYGYFYSGNSFNTEMLNICVKVSKKEEVVEPEMPTFPEKLDVTTDKGLELWQGETAKLPEGTLSENENYFLTEMYNVEESILISGKPEGDKISVEFNLPKGWSGIQPVKVNIPDFGEEDEDESYNRTRSNESDWQILDEVKGTLSSMMGYFDTSIEGGTKFEFNADEKQIYLCYAYVKDVDMYGEKYDFADTGNGFLLILDPKTNEVEEPVAPAFPKELKFTLNGEKEIEGIEAKQVTTDGNISIDITGSCDTDQLTVTFEVPEGWDGMMIADNFGYGTITEVKTRAESEWLTMDQAKSQMFKAGNSITYDADGELNPGEIALVKDNMVYKTFIKYCVTVSKTEEGGDEPGDDAVAFPESIVVSVMNADAEGIYEWQGLYDGDYEIDIYGTTSDDEVIVVLDKPEDWDGFIIKPYSENIEVGEYTVGPKKTRAVENDWDPIENYLADGYVKGNKLTIKANGESEYAFIYLYKDGMVDYNSYISFVAQIMKVPAFPEKLDVTSNVTAEQVSYEKLAETDEYVKEFAKVCENQFFTNIYTCETALKLSGKTAEESATLSFNLPEDWNGVVAFRYDPTLVPAEDEENNELRKVAPFAPIMEEELVLPKWLVPMEKATDFKFAVGEKQLYFCYLATEMTEEYDGESYTMDLIDGGNSFIILVDVESAGSAVDGIEAAGKVRYYDLQGKEISKPVKGAYIKVENGKATKVIGR